MEISKLSSSKHIKQSSSISNKKLGKDFSEEFGSAAKRERDRQLNRLFEEIKKKGKQILETHSINAVHDYKNNIKEYLSLVLKDAYRVEKLRSIYSGNPATLVEIINEELNELAQTVLVQEKGTIAVVSKIEHIEGLLLDTYE